jgi:hypothetical protein
VSGIITIALLILAAYLWLKHRKKTTHERSQSVDTPSSSQTYEREYPQAKPPSFDEEIPGVPFDLSFTAPDLKTKKSVFEVRGSAQEPYKVDLVEFTCTCPDFEHRRRRSVNTFGRLCKHLVTVLNRNGAFENDKWKKAIAETGHGGPVRAWIIKRKDSPPALMTVSSGNEWVNVYAPSLRKGERIANATGKIRRYGWSVQEKRWSYGESPPGARELRSLFASMGLE